MKSNASVLLAAVFLAALPSAWAQRPDGSIGRSAAAAAIDPGIIAFVPFRVSSPANALDYLRDGLPELLAVEFAGEGGPRAVDGGEAARAWARAGVGKQPAAVATATQVARSLGAGLVGYGSVVGSPAHMTVSLTILDSRTGRPTGAPVQAQGSADSLPVLVAGLAAKVLSRGIGTSRVCATPPASMNPEVLRAFMAGLAAYRRASYNQSVDHFSRVIALDQSCTLAAYWLTVIWGFEGGFGIERARPYLQQAWEQRARLGRDERLVVEALVGTDGPDGTSGRLGMHRMLEEAAPRLQRPEVFHFLGENYLHYGALMGYEDWRSRGRAAFERAYQLDSSAAGLSHASTLAFLDGDRQAIVRLNARARKIMAGRDSTDVQVARNIALWNDYAIARIDGRTVAARAALARWLQSASPGGSVFTFVRLYLPSQELDEIADGVERHGNRELAESYRNDVMRNGGQPARLASRRVRLAGGVSTPEIDREILAFAEDDSAAAERLALAVDSAPPARRVVFACEVTLSRLRRGDTAHAVRSAAALRALPVPGAPGREALVCAELIEAIVASMRPGAGPETLVVMDSVLRHKVWRTPTQDMNPHWNYDLGLAFARHGQWLRAAAASRRRLEGRAQRLSVMLRDEGAWALKGGDTTRAIAAWRRWLQLRDNPEPEKAAEVAGIRARLAALEAAVRGRGRGGTGAPRGG